MNESKQFSDEFLQGMKDCKQGKPAPQNASDAYNRGYGTQYQHEQNQQWISENGYKRTVKAA